MKLGGQGDHSSKVKTIAFFLFYWNHFSKNYIQQTPSTGLGSSLCLKDHNSSGRQNCRWLLVAIVLHKFLVFLLHTLEVLSRSKSGSGSVEFLSLICYCGAVTHFVSLYSVAQLTRTIQKLHQWGFPISTCGFNCTAGPATTLGGRGNVARFKPACPWFPGGSHLALVRIALLVAFSMTSLSLPLTEAMGVTPTYIQVIYPTSILLLWQMSWPKAIVGSRKQKTKMAAHHWGTSGQEWNRNRIFEQKTWRNTARSLWCREGPPA